jgi:hypothetical protein
MVQNDLNLTMLKRYLKECSQEELISDIGTFLFGFTSLWFADGMMLVSDG